MTRAKAKQLRKLIEQLAITLDDETALKGVELFPMWRIDIDYTVDDRVKHKGTLYKCVQAHTSQENWTPDATPALWVIVTVEEWPEWVQPAGSHDAYVKGSKVTHNGERWISDVDSNVWEPGVYGWTKQG